MSITIGSEGDGTLVDTSEVQFFSQEDDVPVTTLWVAVDSAASTVLIRIPGMHKTGVPMKAGESLQFRLGHGKIESAYAKGAAADAIRWGPTSNSIS